MIAADKDCVFPGDVPMDQRSHCYLSEGEVNPGDLIKEVTSFLNRVLKGTDPDTLAWETPEGITVKPLYTAADVDGLAHVDTIPCGVKHQRSICQASSAP